MRYYGNEPAHTIKEGTRNASSKSYGQVSSSFRDTALDANQVHMEAHALVHYTTGDTLATRVIQGDGYLSYHLTPRTPADLQNERDFKGQKPSGKCNHKIRGVRRGINLKYQCPVGSACTINVARCSVSFSCPLYKRLSQSFRSCPCF